MQHPAIPTPTDVEGRLAKIIAKHRLQRKISIDEIKAKIYESGDEPMEANHHYMKWWVQKMPQNISHKEMDDAFAAFTDAWNLFPHKSLKGKSPAKIMQQELSKAMRKPLPKEKEDSVMPKMIVGGREMEWDKYWEMIAEMEELQKPFRHWIKRSVLPSYKRYVRKRFGSHATQEKHFNTADIFVERSLQVGFLEFELIRWNFAIVEFPDWWQTHVLFSDLDPDQVRSSLHEFLVFVAGKYNREIPSYFENAGH